MRNVCDNHKSRTALWVCAECDSLYCSDCIDKRIVRQFGKKKLFYFCPKCNIEAEKLSVNPFTSLLEKLNNLFSHTSSPLPKKAKTDKHRGNTLLSKIDMLVEDGNVDDALTLIESESNSISSDINLAERYYHILKLKNKTAEMLDYAGTYLDLLAKKGAKERLCEVYLECVSSSPDFSASPSATFKIAGSMIEAGDPKGAADVYQGFIKNNPENPMIPKATLLAAKVFNEKLQDPQKAAEILEDMIKKHPNNDMAPYIQQYLAQMNP